MERLNSIFKDRTIETFRFLGEVSIRNYNGKKPVKDFFKKKRVVSPENKKKCLREYKNKCADCGSENKVSTHHIIFKGEQGDDSYDNLIALCFSCHRKAHDGYYKDKEYIPPKEFIINVLYRVNEKKYKKKIEERLRK